MFWHHSIATSLVTQTPEVTIWRENIAGQWHRRAVWTELQMWSKHFFVLGDVETTHLWGGLTDVSVSKTLHKEIKEHLEDLLNWSWIRKSKFPYSSPIVCVLNKCGNLCLAIIGSWIKQNHPWPAFSWLHTRLKYLKGSSWFLVLDLGKAYHQGFLEEWSRPLTAFITPFKNIWRPPEWPVNCLVWSQMYFIRGNKGSWLWLYINPGLQPLTGR